MKLENQQLHEIARKFFYPEYLSLLKTRENRKNNAFVNHMNGYTLPSKLLESDIRKTLQSQSIPDTTRSRLESILQSENFISENDPNTENFKNALAHRIAFNWPDQNELVLRNNEETNFSDFINSNPRLEINYPTTRTKHSEFTVLCNS